LLSLLHVSDVHFGPKHLDEPAAAVLDLARRRRPTALVVSGDLTQRAKPRQFRAARRWVEQFPVPVVFIPGNHDVPMYRFWERLLAPFGAWRRHFDPALVRDHVGAGLAVLGVNTAFAWTTKHGRLRPRDLSDLERRLSRLEKGGFRAVAAHHPLAPGAELRGEPVTRRGAEALAICARHGVELVLSGHLHHGFWLEAPAGPAGPGPLVLHCGTTTSSRGRAGERGRNSLNWIEIESGRWRIERAFWQPESGEFRAADAVERRRAGAQEAGPAGVS
jgi:3',5'-cyclic AMP phosphodiesterase CpdA